MNLRVRVSDELLLDAGTTEQVGSVLVIHPPAITLFHQVIDHLLAKPDPPAPRAVATIQHEGVAAAAVVLRWGSYLAVLADSAKAIWAKARSPGTSRICDSEMARINIEASAALAEWVAISRDDQDLHERLVARALAYLPLPRRKPMFAGSGFAILAMPEVAAKLIGATGADRLEPARTDAENHADRLFANALVNTAWRNGPAENIHAGEFHGYPLDRRRVTVAEERTVIAFAADRLTTGMDACRQLALERPLRPWSEQVLPYGLAQAMLITPSGWTLTESTREVRLPRP